MIPLRVCVEGFMCYRDRAELLFDDMPLWALSGPNGSGKSAIFDAMTFALYGVHRGGKQNAKELINQQADGLIVEFDFAIGNDAYRVKRTLSRKGRSSHQAFRLQGSNAVPVTGTEKESGLERWVKNREIIGLDAKTFTASVLLEQGKSDALLKADPKDRHEMLTQIIDLSKYERLHQIAEERHKDLKAQADNYQRQLQGLEPVDEDEINSLITQVEEATAQVKAAQEQLEKLSALKVHAERWGALIEAQASLEQVLNEAHSLLAQADKIQRDAERLAELRQVLPLFQRLLSERQRLSESEARIAACQEEANRWDGKLKEAREELEKSEATLHRLKTQQTDLQRQQDKAQETLLDLSPLMHDLDDMDKRRREVEEFDQALAAFPTDLDQQIARLQEEVERLTELRTALPWLQQFARARTDWFRAKAKAGEAETKVSKYADLLSAMSDEQAKVEQSVKDTRAQVEEMQAKVTEARTLLMEAQKRLKRFEEVEGKPQCDYCGQYLTAEHIETERKRVESELREKEKNAQEAEQSLKTAVEQQRSLEQEAQKLMGQVRELEEKQRGTQETLRDAQREQAQAERQAQDALNALPHGYTVKIKPSAAADVSACFEAEYPTPAELAALQQQVAQHESQKRQLDSLRNSARECDSLRDQRKPVAKRLQELEEKYPAQRAIEIRDAHKTAQGQLEDAKQQLTPLDESLRDAEQHLDNQGKAVKEADEKQREFAAQAQREKAGQEELQRIISDMETGLPHPWQTAAAALTEEQLTHYQSEAESLYGADELHNKLVEAQGEQESRHQQMTQIQQEMAQIPPEAKCPVADLENNEREVREQYDNADRARRRVEQDKQILERRREQRQELENERQQAAHQAQLYKTLADLLGRDNLQRYLLQQAEAGIVDKANEVLDRISGGTLRLELQGTEETTGGVGDGKTASKAFTLVAYNSKMGEGDKPHPVEFLSGSQRFRVAVSLALGIGQYAGQGSRGIESVIIDEGFGSLDQEGRRQMIDELHALKNVLRRIIIVSHQEEFAHDFSNRYAVEVIGGTSRVNPVDPT